MAKKSPTQTASEFSLIQAGKLTKSEKMLRVASDIQASRTRTHEKLRAVRQALFLSTK